MFNQLKTQNKSSTIIQNRNRIRQNIIQNLKTKNIEKKIDLRQATENFQKSTQLKYKLSISHPCDDQTTAVNIINQKIVYQEFQKNYTLQKKIGQGCHATVYKCLHNEEKKVYAVKINKHTDIQTIQNLKNQFRLMKSLRNEKVTQAIQFYVDQIAMKSYFILQYYPHNNLRTAIQKNEITQDKATKIIEQLCKVIKYLHSKGVCHRDIKPDNILWNSQTQEIKLIDFDISKKKNIQYQKNQMWTNTGSLLYRAPQSFQSGYSQKIDLWSLGILAYQLMTKKVPFQSEYECEVIRKICKQHLDLQHLQMSQKMKRLIERLLQKNPEQRMSAQAAEKQFFN